MDKNRLQIPNFDRPFIPCSKFAGSIFLMEETDSKHLLSTDGNQLIPQLSIDCVVFGFHEQQLKVLLLRFKNSDFWSLPGGFIEQDEDLEDAAQRILQDRMGVQDIYLEQFHVFGKVGRSFPDMHKKLMALSGMNVQESHWIFKRFVTVGYYALVDFSKVRAVPDLFSDTCEWFDVKSIPDLIFDHTEIVQKGLETLQRTLDEKLVGFKLLPDTFTMGELQSLYETILDRPLLRTNFQRKMLGLGILERIEKRFSGGAHKAPYLYRFKN
jgi:ADP-ribose pyrophosphatase YjhB (NUDIX family)